MSLGSLSVTSQSSCQLWPDFQQTYRIDYVCLQRACLDPLRIVAFTDTPPPQRVRKSDARLCVDEANR